MKKAYFVVSFIVVLLISGTIPRVAHSAGKGADQTGTSIFLGYDRSHLDYEEFVNGAVLDKDTGWNNGVYFEARTDNEQGFARFLVDYVMTNSATYTGALQDGTPLTMSTKEKFLTVEANGGLKALNFGSGTLSPYLGLGYRDWKRGTDNLPNYQEDYWWWYVAGGANLAYRLNRLVIAADAAVVYPFIARMTTNVAGLFDEATFKLKPRLGYRAELPITFEIVRDKNIKLLIFGTPFYEKWHVGQSDTVTFTQGGVPVATAFEPESKTTMHGFRAGLGLNF